MPLRLLVFMLFFTHSLFVQAQKDSIMMKRFGVNMTKQAPELDGLLTDSVWLHTKPLTEFIQNTPKPGEACSQETEVRMTYDDEAIYIAARMFERKPDSIYNFLTERDWFGNADFFIVVFNSYRDGINGEGFAITPAGVQIDIKYSTIGESSEWDAVWESATHIDSLGWTAELKIPFAALLFLSLMSSYGALTLEEKFAESEKELGGTSLILPLMAF